MFHWNGCRLFAGVPKPNNGRWLRVTARIEQGRHHSSASIRVGSASLKGSSTPKIPQPPVTLVRERRTPEQVRSDASMRVSRLQAALDTLADGDVEEKRALQLALAKAQ